MNVEDMKGIRKYIQQQIKDIDIKPKICRVVSYDNSTKSLTAQETNTSTIINNILPISILGNENTGLLYQPKIGDIVICLKIRGMWVSIGSIPYEINPNTINVQKMLLDGKKMYMRLDAEDELEIEITDGVKITQSGDRIIISKELQANDYYSSDGTQGKTTTVTIDGTQYVYKNGLLVDVI